jgi:hypothetical protein
MYPVVTGTLIPSMSPSSKLDGPTDLNDVYPEHQSTKLKSTNSRRTSSTLNEDPPMVHVEDVEASMIAAGEEARQELLSIGIFATDV